MIILPASDSSLTQHVQNSFLLDSIFNYDDPDTVTEILQLELNSIINSIAPSKVVQYRSDYVPYYNEDILNDMTKQKAMLNRAILSNSHDDWREFKNFRTTVDKKIKNAKTDYLKKILMTTETNGNF